MDISEKLAHLNKERFQNLEKQDGKAAIFAYAGDVFNNIQSENLSEDAVFLQSHLLIISGLYGALKPLDAIKPYRLGMTTKLNEINDLSKFWQDEITNYINQTLEHHKHKYLLNLASQEYSSVINQDKLKYPIINIYFKENRNGKLATIGINAKKARGNMVNVIANNLIDSPELLKEFSYLDYTYSSKDSSNNDLVFVK